MLDEYRIEPISVGQYLDGVHNEDIKIDQAVQRDFCWNKEMMNSLIYSALSRKIYIPNLILAEEKRSDGTKQTYVVDGGQRTETLQQFKYDGYKITNNLRSYIVPYRKKKMDKNGDFVRDEYGNIECEIVEFDIRNKTYNDLPKELKSKFDGCPLTTVIYQDCTNEETSELVLLYNNHIGMNVSQKSLTYVGKYADEIKRIRDTNRFLLDCTVLNENEKKKGFWSRVISECVMGIFHFDNWKKNPRTMCDFLNNNSSEEEYKKVEEYFNRLIPYSDKLENSKVASLFTSKNLFVWLMVFDRFEKLNIPDDNFGKFLGAFSKDLKNQKISDENWEVIDSDRHTRDKNLVTKKITYIETLMMEYLKNNNENTVYNDVEKFIVENVNVNIEKLRQDMDLYNQSLDDLTNRTIRYGSRLLEDENKLSLLAMVVYSYQGDEDLGDWLTQYAESNNTYLTDQRENFLRMKNDFNNFLNIQNKKTA